MSRPDVIVGDGKYTFRQPEDDWKIHVLRYGEPWLVIESGHNAIASLLEELREARKSSEEVKRLQLALGKCTNPVYHGVDCEPFSDEEVEELGPEYEGDWHCECHIEEAMNALAEDVVIF